MQIVQICLFKAISKWFGKNAFKYVISVFQLFVNLHLGLGKNPPKSPKFERIIQELPRHGQEPLRVWLRVLGVIAQIMTLSPQAGRYLYKKAKCLESLKLKPWEPEGSCFPRDTLSGNISYFVRKYILVC